MARAERYWTLFLAGAVLATLALRLYGLDLRSISHPEIYVPGIPLVPGISEPPPRQDLAFALWWHFHDEPHPIGWYLAMFGWVKLFGASEFALRLPGVLFAAGSIPLIALIARRIHGPGAGALAAFLLALHGFHLFWSQTARMYVPGMFWGLMASWLLLRLTEARARRPGLEAGYVLSCLAGIETVELFWPLLLLHVLWAALIQPGLEGLSRRAALKLRPPGTRLLQLQAVTLALAAPELLHELYRARPGAAPPFSLDSLAEYLSFGYLFATDPERIPVLRLGGPWSWLLLALALALLLLSLRARPRTASGLPGDDLRGNDLPGWLGPLAALAAAGLMLWLASIAHRRAWALAPMAALPVMALALPALAVAGRRLLAGILPGLERRRRALHPGVLLLWLLGLGAPAVLFAASAASGVSVLAPRAFLIFMPFLLILCVAGALALPGGRGARLAAPTGLALVFALSVPYAAERPGSPNDYKGLAAGMIPLMQPGDLVFLRKRDWSDTPFFYYMPDAAYVVEDWSAALAGRPQARVWLVTWPWEGEPVIEDARRAALAGWRRVAQIDRLRARAELFVPGAGP